MDLNSLEKKVDETLKQLTQIKSIIKGGKNKTQKKEKKSKKEKKGGKQDAVSATVDISGNTVAPANVDISGNTVAPAPVIATKPPAEEAIEGEGEVSANNSAAHVPGGKRKTKKSKKLKKSKKGKMDKMDEAETIE